MDTIFKDLSTGKIFENHLTFIPKLKERNANRKKMTSEKMKLEKINIWAIILGLVIILQLFQDFQGLSVSKDFPGLDFFLTNSKTFQDFQGPWGPCKIYSYL
jgi:hypothetical protein